MAEHKTFLATPEDFGALTAATAWLKERGFSVGEHQAGCAIGIMLGDVKIAKWTHLDAEERDDLCGFLSAKGNDFRRGDVEIVMRSDKHSSVLEAFFSDPTECGAQASVEHRPLIVAGEIA